MLANLCANKGTFVALLLTVYPFCYALLSQSFWISWKNLCVFYTDFTCMNFLTFLRPDGQNLVGYVFKEVVYNSFIFQTFFLKNLLPYLNWYKPTHFLFYVKFANMKFICDPLWRCMNTDPTSLVSNNDIEIKNKTKSWSAINMIVFFCLSFFRFVQLKGSWPDKHFVFYSIWTGIIRTV